MTPTIEQMASVLDSWQFEEVAISHKLDLQLKGIKEGGCIERPEQGRGWALLDERGRELYANFSPTHRALYVELLDWEEEDYEGPIFFTTLQNEWITTQDMLIITGLRMA